MSQLPPPLPNDPASSSQPQAPIPPQASPPTLPGPLTYGLEPHRSGLILAFGIISLTINFMSLCGGAGSGGFGCFGSPLAICLAIPAWFMANKDLAKMSAGRMDPSGRSNTSAGKVCAIISIALTVVTLVIAFLVVFGVLAVLGINASRGIH